MKSRRIRRLRKKMNRTKKGGFFFNRNKYVAPSGVCDPNNLSSLQEPTELHQKYQQCCPKGTFGTKNSSQYCKDIDAKFQKIIKERNDANEYVGFEPEEVERMKQSNAVFTSTPKKWYEFWKKGGKRTRRNKNRSYRRK